MQLQPSVIPLRGLCELWAREEVAGLLWRAGELCLPPRVKAPQRLPHGHRWALPSVGGAGAGWGSAEVLHPHRTRGLLDPMYIDRWSFQGASQTDQQQEAADTRCVHRWGSAWQQGRRRGGGVGRVTDGASANSNWSLLKSLGGGSVDHERAVHAPPFHPGTCSWALLRPWTVSGLTTCVYWQMSPTRSWLWRPWKSWTGVWTSCRPSRPTAPSVTWPPAR